MKMKLICPHCKEINKFTDWQVVNKNGFVCEHCGLYMEKNILTHICFHMGLMLSLFLGGTQIADHYFYEISPGSLQLLLGMLVIVAAFFILLPLIAFLMCSVTNYKTRKKHSQKNDKDFNGGS